MSCGHLTANIYLRTGNIPHAKIVGLFIKFIKGTNFGTNKIKLAHKYTNTQKGHQIIKNEGVAKFRIS